MSLREIWICRSWLKGFGLRELASRMNRKLNIIVVLVVTVMGIIGLSTRICAQPVMQDNNEATRAKARYYYIQGALEMSQGNAGKAFEYYKRAYEIDPSYDEAAFNYGNQRLFIRNDTLQSEKELVRSMKMLQNYVDRNPRDLYATQMYGYVTTALDTIEESIRVYERAYQLMPKETQLLSVLADSYMRLQNMEKSLESLKKYENIEGKSHDVSLKKITILLATQDTLAAIKEVNDLVEFNPKDPYSRLMKGNLYDVIGEMDSVFSAYREAEVLAPENGAVKMSMAQYYRETGDSVMLDNKIYEALLSEDFELEDKLGILGEYLQKLIDEKGDKTRGDHLFSVLQSQYPHEPQVLDMSARYSAAKGEYPAAVEALQYAIDMEPTNERFWLMLISFQLAQDNYEEAVNEYQRAKEVIQPSLRLKNMYGAAASMLDNKAEAETILKGLLIETDSRLNPDTSTMADKEAVRSSLDYDGLAWVSGVFCLLGDLCYKEGESDKAFQHYDSSLYFLADNPLTLNNYAYFLSEEDKELEKARKMSRRSLDLSDNNPTYLDTYAWILYKLGEYREALEYIELALEIAEQVGDDNEEYKMHYEIIKKAAQEE